MTPTYQTSLSSDISPPESGLSPTSTLISTPTQSIRVQTFVHILGIQPHCFPQPDRLPSLSRTTTSRTRRLGVVEFLSRQSAPLPGLRSASWILPRPLPPAQILSMLPGPPPGVRTCIREYTQTTSRIAKHIMECTQTTSRCVKVHQRIYPDHFTLSRNNPLSAAQQGVSVWLAVVKLTLRPLPLFPPLSMLPAPLRGVRT